MKALAALALLAWATSSHQVQVVTRGPTTHRAVALTFDAGADRGYAPRILSILERNHIRATFGMTGLWAMANRDLVRRMARDGDGFINHTYDHQSFTGLSTHREPLSPARRAWEIERTDSILRGLTRHTTRPFFRPPFGDYDPATLVLLRRLGYGSMVMWTIDSLGWDYLPAPAILSRCLAAASPGTIFLMHVGNQSQDALALQPLIGDLRARHYTFETVSALLSGR